MWLRYYLSCVIALLLSAGAAVAQSDRVDLEEAAAFFESWVESQRAALSDIESIGLVESSDRSLESSRRDFRIRSRSHMEWTPPERGWSRTLLEANVNGRDVDEADFPELQARLRRIFGMQFIVLNRRMPPWVLSLDRLQPTEARYIDTDDGVLYRIEAELPPPVHPPPPRDKFRRHRRRPPGTVTLWFQDGSLRRSTFAFRHRPAGLPFSVTTSYATFDGIDLPIEMEAEGFVQQQRRMRTYTVLMQAGWEFSGHSVERSE